MGRTYTAMSRTLLKKCPKQFERCNYRWGFEPGTCKSTRRGARLKEYSFHLLRNIEFLSVLNQTVVPVQFNTALNQEGIKLPFDQSYQFEVTTDPIGSHYITS
jgi:hypothetical protein